MRLTIEGNVLSQLNGFADGSGGNTWGFCARAEVGYVQRLVADDCVHAADIAVGFIIGSADFSRLGALANRLALEHSELEIRVCMMEGYLVSEVGA